MFPYIIIVVFIIWNYDMSIAHKELSFHEEKKVISKILNSEWWKSISCTVYTEDSNFVPTIHRLLEASLLKLYNTLEDWLLWYDEFKILFEETLEELNDSLSALWSKMNNKEPIRLHWAFQIFFWEKYLWVLIWDSCINVVREHKVYYECHNADRKKERISLFAQLIDWDVLPDDEFILFWQDITQYYDKHKLDTIISKNVEEEKPLIEELHQDINQSLFCWDVWFIHSSIVWSRLLFKHCH